MKIKSKKGFTLVEIMIVVVIIGLLAAMAIPAFNKVRQQSREKAITNNLRQLVSAAQQYMLENGVTSVSYSSLVGSGKHINSITAAAGEDYTGLSFNETDTQITISTNNLTVTYKI